MLISHLKRVARLPYKLTFTPPLLYFRIALGKAKRSSQKWKWLLSTQRIGASIHSSIEISGHNGFDGFITIGQGCVIERDCTLWISSDLGSNPQLELGSNTYVGRNSYLGAYHPLFIGEDTIIGAYCYIITGNHKHSDRFKPVRRQGYVGASIHIGKDVWIGCHVVILPGVTIGDHSIIGAGSVVTKSIPSGEIWAGSPAHKIGERS